MDRMHRPEDTVLETHVAGVVMEIGMFLQGGKTTNTQTSPTTGQLNSAHLNIGLVCAILRYSRGQGFRFYLKSTLL